MIERNDQGKDIEVTAQLHSREWCEGDENDDGDLLELENSLNEPYGFRRHKLVSDEEFKEAVRGKMNG